MMIGGGGEEEDNIFLAVAMPQSITPYIQKDFEEWEDIMREYGAEYIDFEMKGRNEFGGLYSFFLFLCFFFQNLYIFYGLVFFLKG